MIDEKLEFQNITQIADYVDDIAHDLNNSLGGIQGYSQYILKKIEGASPHNKSVQEILKASQRSLDYVQKLLVFSRQYRSKK